MTQPWSGAACVQVGIQLGPVPSVLNAEISAQLRALPPFVVFMVPLSLASYVF